MLICLNSIITDRLGRKYKVLNMRGMNVDCPILTEEIETGFYYTFKSDGKYCNSSISDRDIIY